MVPRAEARARKTAPKKSAVKASSLPDLLVEATATAPPPAPEEMGESRADTPLGYMLRVMRDPAVEPTRRDEMAKLALPYLHPKPTAIEHTGKNGGPIEIADVSQTDLARRVGFLMAQDAQRKPEPG